MNGVGIDELVDSPRPQLNEDLGRVAPLDATGLRQLRRDVGQARGKQLDAGVAFAARQNFPDDPGKLYIYVEAAIEVSRNAYVRKNPKISVERAPVYLVTDLERLEPDARGVDTGDHPPDHFSEADGIKFGQAKDIPGSALSRAPMPRRRVERRVVQRNHQQDPEAELIGCADDVDASSQRGYQRQAHEAHAVLRHVLQDARALIGQDPR